MKNFSFIIVAGGSGSRMQNTRKQFLTLGDSQVWEISAKTAAEIPDVREIILVIPSDSQELKPELEARWKNLTTLKPLKIVFGGETRAVSVLHGLEISACDFVMVHDAARPFVSAKIIQDLVNATDENTGAIPLMPVSDALKKIENSKISCVDRENLFATQTPQSFHRCKLIAAVKKYPLAKDEAEAWLLENHELTHVDGDRLNFKITWREDMQIAEALTNSKIYRTGLGWDIHRLTPERELILGGVKIPARLGLLGHSDADALTHAIMDAILGAAGLPDIGNIFPASDSRFKNANSLELLRIVLGMIHENHWQIEFIDAVIQAQIPKLNPYIPDMKANFAKIFGREIVNIKAKSAEFLDDAGSGLAIICQAVATLRKI